MSITWGNLLFIILLLGFYDIGFSKHIHSPMTLKDASCQNLKGETDITNCTYGFEIVCNKIVCLRDINETCNHLLMCRKNAICCGGRCMGCADGDSAQCNNICVHVQRTGKRFQPGVWQPREILPNSIEPQWYLKSLRQPEKIVDTEEEEQEISNYPYFPYGYRSAFNDI